jgi:hypothetical protein
MFIELLAIDSLKPIYGWQDIALLKELRRYCVDASSINISPLCG